MRNQVATILAEAGISPEKNAEIYKKILMKATPVKPGVIPKEAEKKEKPDVATGALIGAGLGAGVQAGIAAKELKDPAGRLLMRAFPSFGLAFAGGHASEAAKKALIGAGIGTGVQLIRREMKDASEKTSSPGLGRMFMGGMGSGSEAARAPVSTDPASAPPTSSHALGTVREMGKVKTPMDGTNKKQATSLVEALQKSVKTRQIPLRPVRPTIKPPKAEPPRRVRMSTAESTPNVGVTKSEGEHLHNLFGGGEMRYAAAREMLKAAMEAYR